MLQLICVNDLGEREFRDLYFGKSKTSIGVHVLSIKKKESVFLRIRKGKHFPAIKPFFFFDWNSLSFDQLSLCLPNMEKWEYWFPGK